jgi:hypothetical protein
MRCRMEVGVGFAIRQTAPSAVPVEVYILVHIAHVLAVEHPFPEIAVLSRPYAVIAGQDHALLPVELEAQVPVTCVQGPAAEWGTCAPCYVMVSEYVTMSIGQRNAETMEMYWRRTCQSIMHGMRRFVDKLGCSGTAYLGANILLQVPQITPYTWAW